MVLLEAMAAGCAIITTDIAGCNEVVGDAAVKVAPGDVGELREALAKLTGDAEGISHYGRLGRERVGRYSSERIAAQFEGLFAKLFGP